MFAAMMTGQVARPFKAEMNMRLVANLVKGMMSGNAGSVVVRETGDA